jgi:hypothetical protein
MNSEKKQGQHLTNSECYAIWAWTVAIVLILVALYPSNSNAGIDHVVLLTVEGSQNDEDRFIRFVESVNCLEDIDQLPVYQASVNACEIREGCLGRMIEAIIARCEGLVVVKPDTLHELEEEVNGK